MIDACSADQHQRRRADIAEILISQMAANNNSQSDDKVVQPCTSIEAV